MHERQWIRTDRKRSIFACSMNAMMSMLAIVSLFVCTSSSAVGQIVVPDAPGIPALPAEQLHPNAEARISKSLQNPQSENGNASEGMKTTTGDPILDDVLDVIRRQGSILRGSELDPESSLPSIPLDEDFQSQDQSVPVDSSDSQRTRASYMVAEQLLRSARALESLQGMTDRRAELIHGMRSQAAKLLIDAISEDMRPIQP